MTIEQAVLEHLLASQPVTAIVSTRVWQLILPQKPTLPAVRVQRISKIVRQTLKGELTNLFRARVQVDAWTNSRDNADGYGTATDLETAIVNRLALRSAGGQEFSAGGSPAEISVSSVEVLGDSSIDIEGPPLNQIRVRQDFGVMFSEAQ